jgi:glycerophosphoryl diester phosphodiesterase
MERPAPGGWSRPATGYPYLDAVLDQAGSVLAMAHRGGAGHPGLERLENTSHAFRHAVELGYRYLETDVHATSDGEVVAFHDAVLDRLADRTGPILDLSAAEVAEAVIGEGHGVPTMAALLEEFPDCRFNIDVKSPNAVEPLAALIERTGCHDRVLVGSFSLRRINRFRALTRGRVATSAAPAEVVAFLTLPLPRLARLVTRDRVRALQVPRRRGRLPVVTPTLIRRAHAAGAHVHVWTVDEPDDMNAMLDLGVDGLITDRTDLLKDVLIARGLWRDHA